MLRLAVLLAFPAVLSAQTPCAQPDSPRPQAEQKKEWQPPFDRLVTVQASAVSLRDALDRLAAAAQVRFSYTSEVMELDRRVCVDYARTPLGAALAQLLRDSGAQPTAAGKDHVVLLRAGADASDAGQRATEVIALEKIVVTGTATGAAQRDLTVAVDVLSGRALEAERVRSVSDALRSSVPGLWTWPQTPTSLLTQYTNVRGASSFGLTYPKIYLDGIELANPLLLTRLSPESIERVEAIRGPQGAALYGADAISGVVNIVTRNNGFEPESRGLEFGSNIGLVSSEFARQRVLRQEHTLNYQAGSNVRSFALTATGGQDQPYIPNGSSEHLDAIARFRTVTSNVRVNGTARVFAQRAGSGISPLLLAALPTPASDTYGASSFQLLNTDSSANQSVFEFTIGATALWTPNARWTHGVVLGIDSYDLDNVSGVATPIPTSLDSALLAAHGGAARATVRASSVRRFGGADGVNGSLTLAMEHSQLRRYSVRAGDTDAGTDLEAWRQNTGLIGQSSLSLRDRGYITGGLRIERNSGLNGDQTAALPMLGAAYVWDLPHVTLKTRGAFGRGIRPPDTGARHVAYAQLRESAAQRDLEAESQSGFEGGIDLWIARRFSLQITRFDQTASGLIQQVALPTSAQTTSDVQASYVPGGSTGGRRPLTFELQNVGVIRNSGWEAEAAYRFGAWSLAANGTATSSRVREVAEAYQGDLRAGDRMLNVPAHTLNLIGTYTAEKWQGSITASRAFDWIGYDRAAIARTYVDPNAPTSAIWGTQLRSFWRSYAGVTHLRANARIDLSSRLRLSLAGENLLDHQRGEPDNVSVLPGRTLLVGLEARFQ